MYQEAVLPTGAYVMPSSEACSWYSNIVTPLSLSYASKLNLQRRADVCTHLPLECKVKLSAVNLT